MIRVSSSKEVHGKPGEDEDVFIDDTELPIGAPPGFGIGTTLFEPLELVPGGWYTEG
jgi:hypothetical protein